MDVSEHMGEPQEDLLRTGLVFLAEGEESLGESQESEQDMPLPVPHLFFLVKQGKINTLNQVVQPLQRQALWEELGALVNSRDSLYQRTPLFYALYYDYQNLLVYLLAKGADPFLHDKYGQNVFHVALQYGRLPSLRLLLLFQRQQSRVHLHQALLRLAQSYGLKSNQLAPSKLLRHPAFPAFQAALEQEFIRYLQSLVQKFIGALGQLDRYNRNPIHYGAMSRATLARQTVQYLLEYTLELQGTSQLLSLQKELLAIEVDPPALPETKQQQNVLKRVMDLLMPQRLRIILSNFQCQVKQIRKELVNQQDGQGYSAIHLAAFHGEYKLVQFLKRSCGADPSLLTSTHQQDASFYASDSRVRQSLLAPSRVLQQESLLQSVITGVRKHSTQQDMEALFKTQMDPEADSLNQQDPNGWTALHHASAAGQVTLVESLLAGQADLYLSTNKKYLPVHLAALNDHPEVISLLLAQNEIKQSQLEAKSHNDLTPLLLAARKGSLASAERLLQLGANLYHRDAQGQTALHHAASHDHSALIRLLLRHDADYERLRKSSNHQGKLAKDLVNRPQQRKAFETLWHSCSIGDVDSVRQLLQKGEDVNGATLVRLNTPLMLATIYQQPVLVQLLLLAEADPSLKNVDGKTALDYAHELENARLVQLLSPGEEEGETASRHEDHNQ